MRTRSSLAFALALALATALSACSGSSTAPAATAATSTSIPATPSATPTAVPSASVAPTTAPSDGSSPTPSDSALPSDASFAPDLPAVPFTVSDPAASGKGIIINLPANWLVVNGSDVSSEAAITAWLSTHPEVGESSFREIAKSMTDGAVALMAFDTANKTGSFTPNLSITFADGPTGDMTAFLADQAAQILEAYGLDGPYEYTPFSPDGGMAGFIGNYTWTPQEIPLAGLQMILPMDTRIAVLTFTALAGQTDHYGAVLEPLLSNVKQQ